jgi:N-acetyl-1-D-myo-inositol-2-amino-2-deoxy-alpha-D-glucopyranoside deacetylase
LILGERHQLPAESMVLLVGLDGDVFDEQRTRLSVQHDDPESARAARAARAAQDVDSLLGDQVGVVGAHRPRRSSNSRNVADISVVHTGGDGITVSSTRQLNRIWHAPSTLTSEPMTSPAPKTLLVVHAHPDDETIMTGGTLARYSAEGVRTIVVTCTRGDLGEVSDPGLLTDADVGGLRDRELDAAARRLGVSRVVKLGYSDSGMAGWPENHRPGAFFAANLAEAAARLAEVIRQEGPQVMVIYDATGGYGHPDHLKAHQVALAAYEASGDARPAKLYFMRLPLGWSREFVRALRQAGIDAPGSAAAGADAGPDVAEIGVDDDLVTTAIDVRRYVPIKRAALACHASQMPADNFLMRMPLEFAQRLWAAEYFSLEDAAPSVHRGEGLESDLFSGLD